MRNLDLTQWLEIVRDALAEEDEVKRNGLLRAAEMFLKGNRKLTGIRTLMCQETEEGRNFSAHE